MIQLESGLTLDQIESMDRRHADYIFDYLIEKKRRERLQNLIDIAEAVKMGSAAVSVNIKNGSRIYQKWINSIERLINPEKPREESRIWNRKKRSLKF